MRKGIVLLLFWIVSLHAFSSIVDPVTWDFEAEKAGKNEYRLRYQAKIDTPWNLYGMGIPDGGPRSTTFVFHNPAQLEVLEPLHSTTEPDIKFDPGFEMDIPMFAGLVVFEQRVRLADDLTELTGVLEFMVCDDNSCLPPKEEDFAFDLTSTEPLSDADNKTGAALFWAFLIAFAGGVLAIFTPCVFPMIPMIVSFFTRGNPSRSKVIRDALFFGFSMIAIYLSLGLLVSLLNVNPNVANEISSHWISNSVFFVLFVVFALSFFGAFEIMLPGDLANKSDNQANKGGLLGTFFIALTTVIVGFSCTGPIIGAILIEAAGGATLEPVVGMFGFALAFSLPFTLLAFFPSVMKKLPKSGGWMNTVKIIFAFLLLAFSLTFLSKIDQSYHLNLISRELFLSVWIVLSLLLGLYFLGKIRFAHDTELPYVSTSRIIAAIAMLSFSVYLLTGLFGNPLQGLSSLMPPVSEHAKFSQQTVNQMDEYAYMAQSEDLAEACYPPKFDEFLTMPLGLPGYFDYEQGKDCAREQNKPILVVFKGHQCSACKEMENRVWPDVAPLLRDEFVVVALFTDDRKELPESEHYVSEYDGRKKTTVGRKFSDLQISKYNSNTIPFHVLLDAEGNLINTMGHTRSVEEFRTFLLSALDSAVKKEDTIQEQPGNNTSSNSDSRVEVSEKAIFHF